jgi:hypothetical protein
LAKTLRDINQNSVSFVQNLIVPESHYPNTLISHVPVSILIVMPGFIPVMRRTITLDHQLCLSAIEIRDIIAELMLSSEFES